MADKSSSSKETFGLPYDPPSDLDVDRYAPRIDPFLPQPMDFRSKSLENNDKRNVSCTAQHLQFQSRIGFNVLYWIHSQEPGA
jgi:hypothetical protein